MFFKILVVVDLHDSYRYFMIREDSFLNVNSTTLIKFMYALEIMFSASLHTTLFEWEEKSYPQLKINI